MGESVGELLSMAKNCIDAGGRLLEPPCESWPMRRRVGELLALGVEVMFNPGYQGIAFFYQAWWQALGTLIVARAVSRIVLFPFAEVQHYMPEHVDASDHLYPQDQLFSTLGDRADVEDEWVIRQLKTTADLKFESAISRCIDFLMFHGDSLQIEHHLWPAMSFTNLRRASGIVRETCAELGLPYYEITYWDGYTKIWDQVRFHARDPKHRGQRCSSPRVNLKTDLCGFGDDNVPYDGECEPEALLASEVEREHPSLVECDAHSSGSRSRRKRPR